MYFTYYREKAREIDIKKLYKNIWLKTSETKPKFKAYLDYRIFFLQNKHALILSQAVSRYKACPEADWVSGMNLGAGWGDSVGRALLGRLSCARVL